MDTTGNAIAPWLQLARLSVTPVMRSSTPPAIAYPQQATFADVALLLGYDCPPTARAGQPLNVNLYWQAGGGTPTARPYSVFVHLLDAQQNIYGQSDSQPANGSRPTTGWLPGEVISDPHRLSGAGRRAAGQTTPGDWAL